MKLAVIGAAVMVAVTLAYAAGGVGSADRAMVDAPNHGVGAAIDPPDETVVGGRYVVPELAPSVVGQLPIVVAAGDRYLPQRIAVAELVIGERILTAEDLATRYADELPGFSAVLLADGFRQSPDSAWYYDRYASWMRFPLKR